MVPEPEKQARETIDKLLSQAGWVVCDASQVNSPIHLKCGGNAIAADRLRSRNKIGANFKRAIIAASHF